MGAMTDQPPTQPPQQPNRKRKDVDWLGIEADYRAGALAIKVIGAKYGISHTSIIKRARKEGWIRDLAGIVNKVAREHAERNAGLGFRGGNLNDRGNRTEAEHAVFRATVETAAEAMIRLVRQHRATLQRDHELVQMVVDKFESAVPRVQTLEQIAGAMTILEQLTRIRARIIPLERQSFNLDPRKVDDPAKLGGGDDDGFEQAAAALGALEELAATKAGGYSGPAAVAGDGSPGADHPAG